MGGFCGTKQQSTTSTTNTAPWAAQQPYLEYGFGEAKNLYQDNRPQYFPGSTVVPFSPQTEQALGRQETRAQAGSPLLRAAQGEATKTLSGDYLAAGNPYLQQVFDRTANLIRPKIDSQFGASAGGYGSGAHTKSMADALAEAGSTLAYGDYGRERGYQQGMIGAAPALAAADYGDISQLGAVGAARETKGGEQLQDEINRFNFGENVGDENLRRYMTQVAGGSFGGQTQATQPYYSNPFGQAVGGAASLAQFLPFLFPKGFRHGGPVKKRSYQSGGYVGDLTLDERREMLFSALGDFGAGLMEASGPSPVPVGLFGAVGRGAVAAGQGLDKRRDALGRRKLTALQMRKLERDEEAAAREKELRGAILGPYHPVAGGKPWTDPDTGEISYGGTAPPDQLKNLLLGAYPKEAAEQIFKGSETPSNVREWNFYKGLSPDDRESYGVMKRAMPTPLDVGWGFVQPNAAYPRTATPLVKKGLPPQEEPAHKGAVSEAQTRAKAEAERAFNMVGTQDVIGAAREVLQGKTPPTGSLVGSTVDTVASWFGKTPTGATQADQLKAIGGALVAKMPRMEGPQSDKDTAMYREMAGRVGDDTLPIDRRMAALDIVESLWAKYDRAKAAVPTVGRSTPGIRKWNPATGKLE